MENRELLQDIKVESAKGGVAVAGAGVSLLTLNQWVALATLAYILVQLAVLVHKHYWSIQDRRKALEQEDE